MNRSHFSTFLIKTRETFSPHQIKRYLLITTPQFTGIDAGFQYLLVFLVGFMFPLTPLISTMGSSILLLVCALFIGIRLYIRPVYRPLLITTLKTLPSFLFLLFIFWVAIQSVHALRQGGLAENTALNQLRPLLSLLLFFICWLYFRINKDEPFSQGISAIFLVGCSLFTILTGLDILKHYFFIYLNGSHARDFYNFFPWTTDILKLNRNLEFFSALLFLTAIHQKKLSITSNISHIFAFIILFYSIINIGNYSSKAYYIRHINSESVQLGLVLAWLIFILAKYWPRHATHFVFSAILTVLLFAPWIFLTLSPILMKYAPPASLARRLEIWEDTARKILETPLLGHGTSFFKFVENLETYHQYLGRSVVHPHPHNMFLQIWMNLGIIGIFLVSSLLILAWYWLLDREEDYYPGVLATMTIIALFGLITHSIWQSWFMALLSLIILHLTLIPEKPKTIT